MKKSYKIAIIVATVVLVVVAGIIIFIIMNNQPASTTIVEETTNNNQQKPQSSSNNHNQSTAVTLKNGGEIKMGDSITMIKPTYWEGGCEISGTVVNMYDETGRVRFAVRGGVMEFNYRYVIDIQGDELSCGYDGPPEITQINSQIRGVVYLSSDNEEMIHFIRVLDETDNKSLQQYKNMKIDDMQSYDPVKRYNMIIHPDDPNQGEDIPDEVKEIYNN